MANKKAAFEMSITTIVILVIAVIMLIMGLVFVRTIMCKGLSLASTSLDGAEKEINKLFGEGQGEISCVGVEQPLNIAPGTYNIVGCGFRYGGNNKEYTYGFYNIMLTPIGETTAKALPSGWITENLVNRKISSGGGQIAYGTFAIRPPEDAPEGLITLTMSGSGGGVTFPTQTIRLYVRRASFVQKTVC